MSKLKLALGAKIEMDSICICNEKVIIKGGRYTALEQAVNYNVFVARWCPKVLRENKGN